MFTSGRYSGVHCMARRSSNARCPLETEVAPFFNRILSKLGWTGQSRLTYYIRDTRFLLGFPEFSVNKTIVHTIRVQNNW